MVPSCRAGAGVGEEKCSTSVSICAGLRWTMETVPLRQLILIVKFLSVLFKI